MLFFPLPSTKKPNHVPKKTQIYSADILIKKSYKSGPPQFQTLRCEVYVNSYIWRMNKPLNLFLKMGLATLKSGGGTLLKAPSSFLSVKPAVSPFGESHFKNSFSHSQRRVSGEEIVRAEDPRRLRPTDPEGQNRAEKLPGSHPLVQTPERVE